MQNNFSLELDVLDGDLSINSFGNRPYFMHIELIQGVELQVS
jgi:hypothetical protein